MGVDLVVRLAVVAVSVVRVGVVSIGGARVAAAIGVVAARGLTGRALAVGGLEVHLWCRAFVASTVGWMSVRLVLLLFDHHHVFGEAETTPDGGDVAADVALQDLGLLGVAGEPNSVVVKQQAEPKFANAVDLIVGREVGHEAAHSSDLHLDGGDASQVVDEPAHLGSSGLEADLSDEHTVARLVDHGGASTGDVRGLDELQLIYEVLVVNAIRERQRLLGSLLGAAVLVHLFALLGHGVVEVERALILELHARIEALAAFAGEGEAWGHFVGQLLPHRNRRESNWGCRT